MTFAMIFLIFMILKWREFWGVSILIFVYVFFFKYQSYTEQMDTFFESLKFKYLQ